MEKLLTMKELQETLNVSDWTVKRLVRENKLPTLTIGRRRYVTPQAVEDFIDNRVAEAA